MKKKNIKVLLTAPLILQSACRVQTSSEFETMVGTAPLSLLRQMRIPELLNNTAALFTFSIISGVLIFLMGLIYFILHKRDKSFLYLALSSLAGSLVYSLPYWAEKVDLPAEFWSVPMVRTLFLLAFYFLFRVWSRVALYHRTKLWSYVTMSTLFSLTMIGTLLSGHFPVLLAMQWPVPLLATVLILDSLINSILSFQRKSDYSGIAGILILLPLAGGALWITGTRGYSSLFPFLNHLYYLLPSLMIPWQLILTTALIQRRYSREEQRTSILTKMVEDEELQKNKLEELIENLEKRNEEATHIPDYSLECNRRLMGYKAPLPLYLPDAWRGEHRIVSDPTTTPLMGAWVKGNALLFSEATDRHSLMPLLYLKMCFDNQSMEKPAQLLKLLNEKMTQLPFNMDKSISGTLLYFMDDELICGTAGRVRVYLQKKEGKIFPVRGDDNPVTYKEGLGIRPTTREDGKPFRISVEKGDRIVLVSCTLTDRELSATGEIYGQKSLYRVLNSHASADPGQTVQAILKDFDDFDLGNTPDRLIYAGVFARI